MCGRRVLGYDAFMIKVFGHISPDTDATGSAILWAWYLNTHTANEATAYVLGSLNRETQFVLRHWNIPEPQLLESISSDDTVSIVDTNNPQELFHNICDANIIQIVDHHRLTGGLSTKGPIEIHLKPYASTASVIWSMMNIGIDTLPNDMAGLLLSCILSDTLEFRSPTTTPHDKDLAEKLAEKLGIEISSYANDMFRAKSDLSDFTDIDLIHIDSKKSELGDKNIRISVVETTDPASILARKVNIVAAIQSVISKEKDIDDILFFVIDIFREEATVLTYNEFTRNIINASFDVTVSGDTHVLPGIVSRKKQILPSLQLPNNI